MSRSRRPPKRDKSFPIFEIGCPLCDPEAQRQIGLEIKQRDDNKFVRKNMNQELLDYDNKKEDK